MSNFKTIFSLSICLATVFTSCMEQRIIFDVGKDVNQKFFKDIPGIGATTFLKFPVTKKAKTAQVYIASFSERFVESDDLLEYTELNANSNIPSAGYWFVNGYSQDLYLIKYTFEYATKTRTGKVLETPAEGVVFFSLKRNGRGNVLGITPCYFGIIDEDENLIAFNTVLTLKKDNGLYYLKIHVPKKNNNGLLFMPTAFPEHPGSTDDKFNITKIVKLDPNKVGGYKPLVFDVAKIFNDANALSFHFVNTINLTE